MDTTEVVPIFESLIAALNAIGSPMAQTHVDQAAQHLATMKAAAAPAPTVPEGSPPPAQAEV